MTKASVLISSCLLGNKVRYDGGDQRLEHPIINTLHEAGVLISVCPEMLGGLGCPRPPAEIEPGADGIAVLEGKARVMDMNGKNVTDNYIAGAQATLKIALSHDAKLSILKEYSPSCGTTLISDGHFRHQRVPGMGVAAALLVNNNIKVFSDQQLEDAYRYYCTCVQVTTKAS